jgi:hypothetical protein
MLRLGGLWFHDTLSKKKIKAENECRKLCKVSYGFLFSKTRRVNIGGPWSRMTWNKIASCIEGQDS